MTALARAGIAMLPLAITPALLQLLASGALDLGGGEKDLVWILPWFLWSLLYAISSFVLWRRGWPAFRSIGSSAVVGLAGILLAALLLAVFGQLGVAGRF